MKNEKKFDRPSVRKERIGIYGGSFSPPHMGHVHAARAFLSEEDPDRLLIIPAHKPPHKALDGEADSIQRLEMCRLAFSFDKRIAVSDMELSRKGISYTADTLSALSNEKRTLILLMGTDMFLSLDSWHAPEMIFRLAEIVFIRREEDALLNNVIEDKKRFYEIRFGAIVRELHAPPLQLSSTIIREHTKSGNFEEAMLPPQVLEYIRKWKLYTK